MDRIYVLLSLLVSIWTTGHCGSQTGDVFCMDAASKCRGNRECRMALRSLDEKCKVLYGRCGAKMEDLPRCAQIMDNIFSLGFPQEPCRCAQNLQKCFSLHDKIYSHPCFASIRHLRRHKLFPKGIKGSNGFTTPTSESLKAKYFNRKHNSDVKSAFVSNGVTTTASALLVKNKSQGVDKSSLDAGGDDTKTHKVAMTRSPKQIAAPNGAERRGSSIEGKKSDFRQLEDKTDYKLTTIILGTMLGIFILTAVVFFAWMRVRKTLFYTNGKVQFSNRAKEDGVLSSRSEGGMPPRSKAR